MILDVTAGPLLKTLENRLGAELGNRPFLLGNSTVPFGFARSNPKLEENVLMITIALT